MSILLFFRFVVVFFSIFHEPFGLKLNSSLFGVSPLAHRLRLLLPATPGFAR